jgi:TBC1 domain family member 15
VARTDQTIPFFILGDNDPSVSLRDSIDRNENLKKLRHILLTYASCSNFETGYVQGMNDLASPLLETIQNEAISFWAFNGFMDRMVIYSNERNPISTETNLGCEISYGAWNCY